MNETAQCVKINKAAKPHTDHTSKTQTVKTLLLIVHTRLISAVHRACSSSICFHSFSRLLISALCFRMLSNLTKQNGIQGLYSE